MAATDYTQVVQQLYISYFGRPADPTGLTNFTAQLMAADPNAGTDTALTTIPALSAYSQSNPTSAVGKLVGSFANKVNPPGTDHNSILKFVNDIYNNVFHRDADAGGNYWVSVIESGALSRENASLAITEGALSNTSAQGVLDAALVNKVNAIATDFTASLDTIAKVIAFSGDAAAADAASMLTQVTATTSVAAFHSTVTDTIANLGHQNNPISALTAGVDTFVGSAANDVINGVIDLTTGATGNTFTTLDSIDGKAGNDVLNLNILNGGAAANTALAALPTVSVTNVETANIRSAQDLTADVSAWSVSKVNVTQGKAVDLTASSTAAVTVAGTTGTLAIKGGSSQVISASGADVTSGGTAAQDTKGDVTITLAKTAANNVAVTGGANVTVTTTGGDTGTINIGQAGTQQPTGAVKVNAIGADYDATTTTTHQLGTINVKGGTTIEVKQSAFGSTAAAAADVSGVTTITQGAVNVDGAGTATTVTVTQDAAVAANTGTAADAGVKQAATYTFGVLLAGQTMTVAGLTFTALKDLTAAEVATAFSNLTASSVQGAGKVANGSYTNAFAADWTSGAANGATLTFTAKAALTGAATALNPTAAGAGTLVQPTAGATVAGHTNVDYDAGVAGIAGGAVAVSDSGTVDKIATVTLSGYGTGSTVASDALTTLSLANSTGSLAVTNSVQKTLSLTVDGLDTGATVTTPTYENVNLHVASGSIFGLTATGAKALVVDGTASANISTGSTLTNVETVVVKGTAGLNLGTSVSGTTLKSIDTTGTTGTVTASINGTNASYTGGAGVDKVTLVSSASITKAINLGAGDDVLTFNGTSVPTTDGKIDGGTGTNTIVLGAADAETLTGNNSFSALISNFQKASITTPVASATKTVDLANLDGISYVITSGSGASGGTQEVQNFTVTGGVTATKTNMTQTIDFSNVLVDTAGTINIGGIAVTVAHGDTDAVLAGKVAAAMSGATVVTGAGGQAVLANVVGNVVTITFDTRSGSVAALTAAVGSATIDAASVAPLPATTSAGVAYAANAPSLTIGGLAVALAAQDVTAAGVTVAGSGDDTVTEVATKIVAVLDGNATYDAPGTSNAAGVVTVKYTTPADVANITTATAGGVTLGAVTEATKGVASVAAGNLTFLHMANNGTLEVTGAAATTTVTMTDATGTADTLNVKITNASSINAGTIVASAVETIKVELNDTDTTASKITAVHTVSIDDTGLKSLVLTGNAGGIVTHNSTVVSSIDGSALTLGLTAGSLASATVAATIKGGAGADTLTANHTGDILIGGAGNDTLKLGVAAVANGVTLTGGAGNDTFDITGNSVGTVNDYATITDFSKGDILKIEAGNLKFVAAVVTTGSTAVFQDLVNKVIHDSAYHDAGWFQFGGDTYVVEHLNNGATASTSFVNGTDNIVKIVGNVDLSNTASFSDTANTLLIFG